MTQRIAVIGAGPSGLTTAKAVLENGMEPVVFEASDGIGGLWRAKGGYVWNDMRTNLSKWTCAFSDHPWEPKADEFPLGSAVENYLCDYAARFGVDRKVSLNSKVESVTPSGGRWLVKTLADSKAIEFDGVVLASGVFSRAAWPALNGIKDFKGLSLHSSEYKDVNKFRNKRVAVVGASFSGIEIASHLAAHGIEVLLLFGKPTWILPRYAPLDEQGSKTAPLDLLLYRRGPPAPVEDQPALEAHYKRTAHYFESTFGNPGDVNEDLRVPIDGSPPFVAISDSFLEHVKDGGIVPIRERVKSVTAEGIITQADRRLSVDAIIYCTGYEVDFSFLSEDVQKMLSYNVSDKLISHIADRTVMHPEIANLYLVGLYRGPYFGIMELQARWAAGLLSGSVQKPTVTESEAGLDRESEIRARIPRPQFPHGEYVAFADELAAELGIFPNAVWSSAKMKKAVMEGPVLPAHYRLTGPHANIEAAESQIKSACDRVGLEL